MLIVKEVLQSAIHTFLHAGLVVKKSPHNNGIVRAIVLGGPVWKVCIVRPRSRPRSFDVPYIFYSKFLKSRARNLQTFQSGRGATCM